MCIHVCVCVSECIRIYGKLSADTQFTINTITIIKTVLEVTKPSPFAEVVQPDFNTEPKKTSAGRGRKGKAAATEAVKKEKSNSSVIKGESAEVAQEKKAATKAVRDAFELSDSETPPPTLADRIAKKSAAPATRKASNLKQKSLKVLKKVDFESDIEDDDDFAMEVDTPPLPIGKPVKTKTAKATNTMATKHSAVVKKSSKSKQTTLKFSNKMIQSQTVRMKRSSNNFPRRSQ